MRFFRTTASPIGALRLAVALGLLAAGTVRADEPADGLAPVERSGARNAAQAVLAARRSHQPDPALARMRDSLVELRAAIAELRSAQSAGARTRIKIRGEASQSLAGPSPFEAKRAGVMAKLEAAQLQLQAQSANLVEAPQGGDMLRAHEVTAWAKAAELCDAVAEAMREPNIQRDSLLELERRLQPSRALRGPLGAESPTITTRTRHRRPGED